MGPNRQSDCSSPSDQRIPRQLHRVVWKPNVSSISQSKRIACQVMKSGKALAVVFVACAALAQTPAPPAHAVPGPEVEYTYDVMVRRHYDFPNNDAIGYGYAICNKVTSGESYSQVMGDVKGDVSPNDEFAANYLVSYAVGVLCPAQISQLRNSAAGYQPPPG